MKNIFLSTVIFLFSLMLISCGKTSSEKDVTKSKDTKTTTNKTAENQVAGNETNSGSVSNPNLFTVEAVEKSGSKNTSPNVIWTEDGKKVSLNDLKGKVVLLNFWATWCGPCIREMPDLSTISEEMKGKDFRLIGMNVFQQDGTKKVDDFLKSSPVKYTVLDGNQEVVDAFGEATGENVEAVPTTFIIDKKGKIAETIVGARNKEAFVKIINKYLN
ncbi:MAG: TlpA family protein disulfide reductase [Bacteroidetes bacterium]|nr:TlpA family protein disulfide reductase [Bacteroidota bacterium]